METIKKDAIQPKKDATKTNWKELVKPSTVPMSYAVPVNSAEYARALESLRVYNEASDLEQAGAKKKVDEALKDLNTLMRREQVNALYKEGVCAYLSHPFCFKAGVRKNSEGVFEIRSVVSRLFPRSVGDNLFFAGKGEKLKDSNGRMTIKKGWIETFKDFAETVGVKYFFTDSDEEQSHTGNVSSMSVQKAAFTACIKAVLGDGCGIGARKVDVVSLKYAVRERLKNERGAFGKIKQGEFFWFIIDSIAMRAAEKEYTLKDK